MSKTSLKLQVSINSKSIRLLHFFSNILFKEWNSLRTSLSTFFLHFFSVTRDNNPSFSPPALLQEVSSIHVLSLLRCPLNKLQVRTRTQLFNGDPCNKKHKRKLLIDLCICSSKGRVQVCIISFLRVRGSSLPHGLDSDWGAYQNHTYIFPPGSLG